MNKVLEFAMNDEINNNQNMESPPVVPAPDTLPPTPPMPTPTVVDHTADPKPNKGKKKFIFIGILIFLVLALITAAFFLIPSDEKVVSSALRDLKDMKNMTITASKATNENLKSNPEMKLDLEAKTMQANFELAPEGEEYDDGAVEMNIYSENDDIYVSGKDFAAIVNMMLGANVDVEDLDETEYSFESGWIKLEAGEADSNNNFNEFSAKAISEQFTETFGDLDEIEAEDIEILSKTKDGRKTTFVVESSELEEAKVELEGGKVISISRGEADDEDYIAVAEIDNTNVEKISMDEVFTLEEAAKEAMSQLIKAIINGMVENGTLEESQRAMMEAIMLQYVNGYLSEGLTI